MKLVIMQFGPFEVLSYGNGTAYDVRRNGEHFYLQGDDASQFRDECETEGWETVCAFYMETLGQIYA